MQIKLIVLEGDSADKFVIIPKDKRILIGRDEDSDFCLVHNGVSRKHGYIWQENGTCWIEDLQSFNGIYVNNYKVDKKMALGIDNIIQIGVTKLKLKRVEEKRKKQEETIPLEDVDIVCRKDRQESTFSVSAKDMKLQKYLSLLHAVGKLVQKTRQANEMIGFVLEGMLFGFVASRGCIIVKETQYSKKFSIYRSFGQENVVQERFTFKEEMVKNTLYKGESNLGVDKLAEDKICSIICAPVEGSFTSLGAIYLDVIDNKQAFDKQDLDMLTAIGRQVGLALERINLEDLLRFSASHHRSIYESIINQSNHVIYRQNLNGQFEFISPFVEKLLGLSTKQLCQNPSLWIDSVHLEDRERIENGKKCVLEEKKSRLQYRMITVNAETIWVEEICHAIKNGAGEIICIQGIVQNITKTKRLEKELEASSTTVR